MAIRIPRGPIKESTCTVHADESVCVENRNAVLRRILIGQRNNGAVSTHSRSASASRAKVGGVVM